jgi:cyclic-di-GMP-binding protein
MLKLTVPDLGSTPSDAVETRPKMIRAWLERLPFASPVEAARQLIVALAEMNRTPLNDAARYRCLTLMHPVIMRLAAGLEPLLAESGIPPSRNSRQAGELLRELWLEFGYGYKQVLLSLIGKRSGLGGGQRFVDVTTRLLLAMRNLQFACYQTYSPPPRGLWREMHHLYLFAHEAGFADKAAADNDVTASLVYRQALLMALADPHHLEPEALQQTRRYLKRHAALAQLTTHHDPCQNRCFLILSDADCPSSLALAGTTKRALGLRTDRLCQHLLEAEARLKTGDSPRTLGLSEGLRGEFGQNLLRRLQKSWSGRLPRAYRRHPPAVASLRLVAGVTAVHRMLVNQSSPEEAENPGTLTITGLDSVLAAAPTPQASTWHLINDSAGGLALTTRTETPLNLKIGDPLALQENTPGNWTLGVIRWIRMSDSREVEIGVERLSPQIEPVWIRPVRKRRFDRAEPALLVRGVPAQKRRDCLLLPRDLYRNSRDAELLHAQHLDCITFGHRVEQSPSYDLVEFSRFQ